MTGKDLPCPAGSGWLSDSSLPVSRTIEYTDSRKAKKAMRLFYKTVLRMCVYFESILSDKGKIDSGIYKNFNKTIMYFIAQ